MATFVGESPPVPHANMLRTHANATTYAPIDLTLMR
jgi:hypothetical protein